MLIRTECMLEYPTAKTVVPTESFFSAMFIQPKSETCECRLLFSVCVGNKSGVTGKLKRPRSGKQKKEIKKI